MGAERVFADWSGTDRAELRRMIEAKGIREGDTLVVRAVGDLGKGAESKRIQKAVAALGATIEVVPADKVVKLNGRPPRIERTPELIGAVCPLWYSPGTQAHVLGRVKDITGRELTRHNMNYLCGPRDGSRKPK